MLHAACSASTWRRASRSACPSSTAPRQKCGKHGKGNHDETQRMAVGVLEQVTNRKPVNARTVSERNWLSGLVATFRPEEIPKARRRKAAVTTTRIPGKPPAERCCYEDVRDRPGSPRRRIGFIQFVTLPDRRPSTDGPAPFSIPPRSSAGGTNRGSASRNALTASEQSMSTRRTSGSARSAQTLQTRLIVTNSACYPRHSCQAENYSTALPHNGHIRRL
jgi:hypothetical protein